MSMTLLDELKESGFTEGELAYICGDDITDNPYPLQYPEWDIFAQSPEYLKWKSDWAHGEFVFKGPIGWCILKLLRLSLRLDKS